MGDNEIEFTREKLEQFKRELKTAKKNGEQMFIFEGHEVLVTYGEYLIQYLETKFNG